MTSEGACGLVFEVLPARVEPHEQHEQFAAMSPAEKKASSTVLFPQQNNAEFGAAARWQRHILYLCLATDKKALQNYVESLSAGRSNPSLTPPS